MEILQSQRVDLMLGIAVALVALGAGTAYYFYLSNKKPKGCLDPDSFKEFKLVKRTQLSHNVAKFRFALPTPNSVLGLPIGQHMSCRGKDSPGEDVIKPYTPTTLDSDIGYFDLVIKMYPQGRMSHHFREMCEGDYLSVKGPKAPEGWDGGVGFISKEMIQDQCPAPAPNIQILRCGPPPMNKAMAAHLDALGYTPQMQFQF